MSHPSHRRTVLGILFGVFLPGFFLGPFSCPRAAGEAVASSTLTLNEEKLWGYAETLFAQGEYYRAISEYQRLMYFFPASTRRGAAALRIAEAHLNGGEPEAAERHLSALLQDRAWEALAAELRFLRAVARLEQGAGRPYPMREPQVRAALGDLRELPANWHGTARAREFQAALEKDAPQNDKSPGLAAGLSAVAPGLGSVYVGRYREGALAFFVNGVFWYAAANAWRHGREGLATVLGTAALAFYGGAIYAAANGAHQRNDRARSQHLDEQRTRWGLIPRADGIFARLETKF